MAQGHNFPNITPSQRTYTPGRFPTNEFQSLNGSVTTLQYGVQKVDSELSMTFTNITDAEADAILTNYEQANGERDVDTGERDWVILPSSNSGALEGVTSTALRQQMGETYSGAKLRYRYAEPPVITSVFPGRSTVRIKLRGYLEGAKNF